MPRTDRFTRGLLAWGGTALRDLPWRRTRDPWAILVAELMLQQTQAARVIPRYIEFLDRYPTPRACAEAARGEIITAWAGLGYNRRAIGLHQAALQVIERHGGEVPTDLDDLLALPGVGPYTARAVQVFAHEADGVGVLDTNVGRVVARAVAGQRLTRARAQEIADGLVPAGQGWLWNQAVMELGARVCLKRHPRCSECPVSNACAWNAAGLPAPDPATGSAGVSTPQAPFVGSDRQGRGRLVAALRTGPLALDRVADAAGWSDDPDRARRVADGLVAEGMAEYVDGMLSLPA